MITQRFPLILLIVAEFAFGATAAAETYLLPSEGNNVIGELQVVRARHEDTLSDIARRYNIGYQEIVLANPDVDPWLPGEGSEILVPTQFVLPDAPRDGVVINVPEMRLYYYPKKEQGKPAVVETFPLSIGRQEWNTPLGTTKIVMKQENPTWFPPESIRDEHAADGEVLPTRIGPGPQNPLGKHALRLGIPGYLIHGTNMPYGVGMRVTHGCVRLYPEDIRHLFDVAPVGTPVHIVNQPYKAGWRAGFLFVEAHPPLEEDVAKYATSKTPMVKTVVKANPDSHTDIDWEKVLQLTDAPHGVPTVVSTAPLDVLAALTQTQESVLKKIHTLTNNPALPAQAKNIE